ncbi:SVSP family protein [Theileria parva strain Muguga]|uniref:Theileria-specific sub-telomeric protein, SVSP family member n=1 Tax=Theileria parva TaxID=5875 RepID=Q4N3H0_THEPA|nr:SVSP family protein [Theileria parva strain Muguga]EAN31365.1 SVSP family protein [Theileria parva strain Muguga]|eukprot:XP_763648.1 hypothetical protein [Theileria parva strain Muguga]
MNSYITYNCIFLFILFGSVRSADKINNKSGDNKNGGPDDTNDLGLVPYSDSEGEGDGDLKVTETSVEPEGSGNAEETKSQKQPEPSEMVTQPVEYSDPNQHAQPVQYYNTQPVQLYDTQPTQQDGIPQQPIPVDPLQPQHYYQQVQYVPGPEPGFVVVTQEIDPTFIPSQPIPIQHYDPYQHYIPVQHTYYGPQPYQPVTQYTQYVDQPQPYPQNIPYGPQQQFYPVYFPESLPMSQQQYYPEYQQSQLQPFQQQTEHEQSEKRKTFDKKTKSKGYDSSKFSKKPEKRKSKTPVSKPSELRGQPLYKPPTQAYPTSTQQLDLGPRFRPPTNLRPLISGPAQDKPSYPQYTLYRREQTKLPQSKTPTQPTHEHKSPAETSKPPETKGAEGLKSETVPVQLGSDDEGKLVDQLSELQLAGDKPKDKPAQPTEPSGSDQQLQPEHIPVEVGSDDEEPEEGAAGGEDGDEDKKEKKPEETKKPKKCKSIIFMKKDEQGILVPMIEIKDYMCLHYGFAKTKYNIFADLEQVVCDGEVIYFHIPEKDYVRKLTYNRKENAFIMERVDMFVLIKRVNGKWSYSGRRHINYIKMYTQDALGNEVEMTKEQYYVEMSPAGSIKYTFVPGVKCKKLL